MRTIKRREGAPGGQSQKLVPVSSTERVVRGILDLLENRRLIPGQRLIETELAARFQVGRNAVREAMQQLSGTGIIALSPNCSPSIRQFSATEALEILEVAEVLTGLLAGVAARHFKPGSHGAAMRDLVNELTECSGSRFATDRFNQARKRFYRTLLAIAGNREMRRSLGAIHMDLIYSCFQSTYLQEMRRADYLMICSAVAANNVVGARMAAKRHVRRIAAVVRQAGLTP